MAQIYFLNQAKSFIYPRKFLNFMVMQIGKPENEGTYFRVSFSLSFSFGHGDVLLV